MEEIKEWLSNGGQDFVQGVALYEAHGKSGTVRKTLALGPSTFTRGVLLRVLRQLVEAPLPVPAKLAHPTPHASVSPEMRPIKCHANTSAVAASGDKKPPGAPAAALQPPINPHEPPRTDELRRQLSAFFAERNRLHAQLELVSTDAERHRLAARILELAEAITIGYDAAAGRGPAAAAPTPRPDLAALTDAGEIRRLLANLRPQASKLRKNPARAAALAQVLADINLLESKLSPTL